MNGNRVVLSMRNDLTGQRFGRLIALQDGGRTRDRKRLWLCRCDCGGTALTTSWRLKSGATQSCGCLLSEAIRVAGRKNRTHGKSGTPIYHLWRSMLSRCEDPADDSFLHYGARGIAVCERWQKFENFYADMGERPEGMTLDRRDNDAGYSPQNCRWATATAQARNRRSNRTLEHDGQARIVSEWAEVLGMSTATLNSRLHNKWPVALALTVPVDMRYSTRRPGR